MRLIRVLAAGFAVAATALVAPVAAATEGCPVVEGAQVGVYECGTHIQQYHWTQENRDEVFVLGTNGVVYDVWQRFTGDTVWSPWVPLGSSNNVANGVWLLDPDVHNDYPIVTVTGGDGQRWCDAWLGGGRGWGNWYPCPTG
jgi:hypothetical protein